MGQGDGMRIYLDQQKDEELQAMVDGLGKLKPLIERFPNATADELRHRLVVETCRRISAKGSDGVRS